MGNQQSTMKYRKSCDIISSYFAACLLQSAYFLVRCFRVFHTAAWLKVWPNKLLVLCWRRLSGRDEEYFLLLHIHFTGEGECKTGDLRSPLAPMRRQSYNRRRNITSGGTAMEYLTVRETAKKWNISTRMVQQLCTAGRIPGAQKFGTAWAIPANAEKHQNPRFVPKQEAAPGGTSPGRSITTSQASRNRRHGRWGPISPALTWGRGCPPA